MITKKKQFGSSVGRESPAMWEMWVREDTLGREDALEEGMVTTPVFLPGESPWTEEPGSHEELDMTERLSTAQHTTSRFA